MVDQRIANTCIARNDCKQHGVLCGTACPWHIDLRYQLEMSGIPKRHSKWTVDMMPDDTNKLAILKRFVNDPEKGVSIIDRVENGQGLYLYGTVGTGKTTAVCSIAMSYIVMKSQRDLREGNRTHQLVQYVNIPDLLDLIKRGFDDDESAKIAEQKMKNLRKVPLVILDDIGAERPSEWARERLLTVIGSRYDNELSTFLTSNLTLKELREIDPTGRIPSRIAGMSVPIEFTGADRRRLF